MMPALQNSRSFLTREFNPDRKKGKKKKRMHRFKERGSTAPMRNYNNLPQEVITLVAGRAGQESDSLNRLYEIPFGLLEKGRRWQAFPSPVWENEP